MFVATVTVDLHTPRAYESSRDVEIVLGLSDEDAMFAFHKSWYKITNTIAQLTPWRVTVKNVQFSPEDRVRLIEMADEERRQFEARQKERESYVLSQEEIMRWN